MARFGSPISGSGSAASQRQFIVALTTAAALLVLLLFSFSSRVPTSSGGTSGAKAVADVRLPASCERVGRRYGIMFDAGSTGSRVHVYDFTYTASGGVKLHGELFEQVRPGLSSFKDDPAAAAASVRSLIDKAIAAVPAAKRACTPMELKATAGLRLLGKETSEMLLAAVESEMRSSGFFVPKANAAIVLGGEHEGPYAWMTVNFLLGSLTSSSTKTAAVLDLGGASTQVVFLPDSSEVLKSSAAEPHRYPITVFGQTHVLYQHSHLGYGLKEATKSISLVALDGAAPSTMEQAKQDDSHGGVQIHSRFPCYPKGYALEHSSGKRISNIRDGTQSFEQCRPFVRDFIRKNAPCSSGQCSFNSVFQPSMTRDFSGPIYAFSYFFDRLSPFTSEREVTVGEFARLGRLVCGESTEEKYASHNLATMCMDYAYLYELLRTGYDLPDDRKVIVTDKIDGVETAWTLGAMMVAME